MVDQGMFSPRLTSINRCFFEIQGISSFFRPSPLPRRLPNNAPQHTWSRCVLSSGHAHLGIPGRQDHVVEPLTTKGSSRTTMAGAPGSTGRAMTTSGHDGSCSQDERGVTPGQFTSGGDKHPFICTFMQYLWSV